MTPFSAHLLLNAVYLGSLPLGYLFQSKSFSNHYNRSIILVRRASTHQVGFLVYSIPPYSLICIVWCSDLFCQLILCKEVCLLFHAYIVLVTLTHKFMFIEQLRKERKGREGRSEWWFFLPKPCTVGRIYFIQTVKECPSNSLTFIFPSSPFAIIMNNSPSFISLPVLSLFSLSRHRIMLELVCAEYLNC